MKPELVPLLVGFFSYVGALCATPMFPEFNRPRVFMGGFGAPVFGVLNLILVVGSISLVVWSFIHVTWYIAVALIVGGIAIGTVAGRILQVILLPAFCFIISSVAIFVLHHIAWFTGN